MFCFLFLLYLEYKLCDLCSALTLPGILPNTISNLWKTSTVIQIPKRPPPTALNHYRAVALTSVVMKCLERILLNIISLFVTTHPDTLQFVYNAKGGTANTVAYLLHLLLQPLDSHGNYTKLLFVDFSSAFNTIQKHRTSTLPPSDPIRLRLPRPDNKKMRVDSATSPLPKTGAPQGCVLSSYPYFLYTNDPSTTITYLQYEDDTVILTLLSDTNSAPDCHCPVTHFAQWCKDNHLQRQLQRHYVHTPLTSILYHHRQPDSGILV